jgi:hypothetical protein
MGARANDVERLNEGSPIVAPRPSAWENGVTFNAACEFLERSPKNDPIIQTLLATQYLDDPRLNDGVRLAARILPATPPIQEQYRRANLPVFVAGGPSSASPTWHGRLDGFRLSNQVLYEGSRAKTPTRTE